VIENTISIAAPASTPIDPKDPADPSGSSGGGGGGGCVYNPNAPARFDMGFILLMVLRCSTIGIVCTTIFNS
jgi:hypothetical protein